ncbi:MAG: serine/threonine protein kinase [Vitreoscilla sp.]|nr:serine/threonine protein kinase [Vitreoscilla sp.]
MNIARSDWPRLLTLVEQALDMAPTERERWVGGLGLAEPLHGALLGLLRERQAIETGDFLGMLPAVGPGPHAPGRLAGGALVGPWRLLHEIGQGGMSTVWLAERADAQVKRQVALKLPHAGPGQDLLAARLLRERNILAALEHRNVARLYDVGVSDAGTPYLVMEYVPGTDLLSHADARRLTMPQRLVLFQQVLRAVQYAHGKLVLHRDLKPSNILVNEAGDVKLLDFGIAKVLADDAGSLDETELTRAAGRQLTPRYASPEQLRGEALGTASDVYSMGVILFELLTGERPYVLPRDSRAALEDAVLNDDPRRPSAAWPAGRSATHFGTTAKVLNRALTGDLDVIVLTALQKDPAQRYPTADAMAQDLQRHLAHEPILAQASSRWVRLRKFTARHAVAVAAGASVFAALSLGLGAAVWQGQQARQEANKANAIKDFLVTLLRSNELDQVDAPRKRQQTVQQVLEQSAASLRGGLTDQPEVRSELQVLVGGLLQDLEMLDAALPLRRQRVADLAAAGAPLPERVQALRDMADSQQGDLPAAHATLAEALALCEGGPRTPSVACLGAALDMGRAEILAKDLELARQHIEPAAAALRQRASIGTETVLALRTLGELRDEQGLHDEGFALMRQAIAQAAVLWGPRSARLADERSLLADRLALRQRQQQAMIEREQAWQTMVAAAGPDSVRTARYELDLGIGQARIGLAPEAGEHIRHASTVLLASSGPDRARLVFNAHRALAEWLLYGGQLNAAGQALNDLDEARRAFTVSPDQARDADLLWARYWTDTGQFEAALTLLKKRRDATLAHFGAGDGRVADLSFRIAKVLLAQGQLAGAEESLEKIDTNAAPQPAPGDVARQLSQSGRAATQLLRGDFTSAWPTVLARYQAVTQVPRGDQYLVTALDATEQMARVLHGLGRPTEARAHFERAIGLLEGGYAHNPLLAAIRARYASCLLALNERGLARSQVMLAQAALRAEPSAGPQFRRDLATVVRELE